MAQLAALLKAKLPDNAAHDAATSDLNLLRKPTEAQAKAGNYRKGHTRIGGLDIAIENPAGSRRRPEWPPMQAHYGYVKRTEGADGDHVDVFIRPGTPNDWAGTVYVIDQIDADGTFDEHKVMVGFDDEGSATRNYLEHYPAGWMLGKVTALTWAEFKAWLRDGDTRKPLAKAIQQSELLAVAERVSLGKEWAASASPTGGITAYGNTGRKKRRVRLKAGRRP